jgi:hypothetical protein
MAHIFISYKRTTANTRFVNRMSQKLREAGFEPWIDTRRLRAGEDWRDEIDQAIRDSLALIVVLSPDSITSQYVTYEWAFAFGVGVPVIPVLYRKTDLHPRLAGIHYLDFESDKQAIWDALVERLREINE